MHDTYLLTYFSLHVCLQFVNEGHWDKFVHLGQW